jgi:hypothetical protein
MVTRASLVRPAFVGLLAAGMAACGTVLGLGGYENAPADAGLDSGPSGGGDVENAELVDAIGDTGPDATGDAAVDAGPDASSACVDSSCPLTCDAGYLLCGGACVNLTTDRSNCGGCGAVCTGTATCQGGVCVKSHP